MGGSVVRHRARVGLPPRFRVHRVQARPLGFTSTRHCRDIHVGFWVDLCRTGPFEQCLIDCFVAHRATIDNVMHNTSDFCRQTGSLARFSVVGSAIARSRLNMVGQAISECNSLLAGRVRHSVHLEYICQADSGSMMTRFGSWLGRAQVRSVYVASRCTAVGLKHSLA